MNTQSYDAHYIENVQISRESASLFETISQWTKFLAIVQFIMFGLMTLIMIGSLFALPWTDIMIERYGSIMYIPANFNGWYIVLWVIVLAAYFLPAYFLLTFSNRMKRALESNNSRVLTDSIRNLKNYYLVIGIITIVQLATFIVALIMTIVGLS